MGTERLTTLADVKEWLAITSTSSDAQLGRLIDAASQFTLNWLARPTLLRQTYTQTFKGNGKDWVLLGNWPVISVTSVVIGSQTISPSIFTGANPSSGYFIPPYHPGYVNLELNGYAFYRGTPAQITYVAGFETSESDVIPATPHELTPSTGGMWSVDRGVTIDGVAATKVDSAPAAGQYSVNDSGKYTFNSADATKLAVMSYGYVPYDIQQAVTDIVGEWFKSKERIGLLSKTLGGQETVTFTNRDIGPVAAASLQPYKNVVSVA